MSDENLPDYRIHLLESRITELERQLEEANKRAHDASEQCAEAERQLNAAWKQNAALVETLGQIEAIATGLDSADKMRTYAAGVGEIRRLCALRNQD